MTSKKSKKDVAETFGAPMEADFELVEERDGEAQERQLTDIKKVQEKLKICQKERQEFLDGWQRSKADFLNQKKRLQEEQERGVRRAKADILRSILALADSFDLALKDTNAWGDAEPSWLQGVKGIHAQLTGILREQDVAEIPALGAAFDPEVHEAIGEVTVGERAFDAVVREVGQKGYTMGKELLRPARVIIGKYKDE